MLEKENIFRRSRSVVTTGWPWHHISVTLLPPRTLNSYHISILISCLPPPEELSRKFCFQVLWLGANNCEINLDQLRLRQNTSSCRPKKRRLGSVQVRVDVWTHKWENEQLLLYGSSNGTRYLKFSSTSQQPLNVHLHGSLGMSSYANCVAITQPYWCNTKINYLMPSIAFN